MYLWFVNRAPVCTRPIGTPVLPSPSPPDASHSPLTLLTRSVSHLWPLWTFL